MALDTPPAIEIHDTISNKKDNNKQTYMGLYEKPLLDTLVLEKGICLADGTLDGLQTTIYSICASSDTLQALLKIHRKSLLFDHDYALTSFAQAVEDEITNQIHKDILQGTVIEIHYDKIDNTFDIYYLLPGETEYENIEIPGREE